LSTINCAKSRVQHNAGQIPAAHSASMPRVFLRFYFVRS
jgi:hypothetical protein